MPPGPEGRWPPVYDATDLKVQIDSLATRADISSVIFGSTRSGGPACQGDVLRLDAEVPVLDPQGQPALMAPPVPYWLVIGNTCDFYRSIDDVAWTQVVPLESAGSALEARQLEALRRYRLSRRFYVPPWPGGPDVDHRVADFLRPVALHKRAITGVAKLEARMTHIGWVLLHSCLVRFLARDDGRFDSPEEQQL